MSRHGEAESDKAYMDAAYFASVAEVHRNSVFDVAKRIVGEENLAEDVAQETFLTFYRKAPRLPSDQSLRAWLLETARRHALKRRSGNSRRALREARYAMNQPNEIQKEMPVVRMEAVELHLALNTLPQENQLPVALHYLHGLSQSEVASVLKIPVGTVGSRIVRGLERLRALLERRGTTTAGAVLSIGILAESLKALPLANAPSTIGALESIRKLDAGEVASDSVRHITRTAPKAGGQGFAGYMAAATVAVLVAGGTWLATRHQNPAAIGPGPAAQYSVTFQSGKVEFENGVVKDAGAEDCFLYADHKDVAFKDYDKSYGVNSLAAQTGRDVPLIRFAVFERDGGPLPNDTEVLSAHLMLYKENTFDAALELRQCLSAWKTDEVSWNRSTLGTAWKSPGGDAAQSFVATTATPWGENLWCDFDVSSSLRQWQTEGNNFGWILNVRETLNIVYFASSRHANPSVRPKLVLTVKAH